MICRAHFTLNGTQMKKTIKKNCFENFLRAFFIFICAFFFTAADATDAASSLSKTELEINDTFTITGEGFGAPFSPTSYLCFNDTSHCVSGANFSAHPEWLWSDTLITAQAPTAVATTGDVLVYVQAKKEECFPEKGFCQIKTFLEERGRAAYKIIPKIFSITPAPSGKKGEIITLKGTGFGDIVGEVYFDSYLSVIKQWNYGSIDIETPAQFIGSTKRIIVKGSNGLSSSRNYRVAAGITNDEFSHQQEYLEQIFIPEAWRLTGANTQEVIVAVLDDGVLLNHPDLEAHMWKNTKEVPGNGIDDDFNGVVDDVSGYNFLENTTNLEPKGFHGTAVAGIIGAIQENGIGIGGIVKNVSIMPLIVADAKGTTNSTIVERAIRYAADNGAHVINLSFSTTGENGFFPQIDIPIQYAFDKGSVVVAAAGNGDVDTGIGINVNSRPQSPVCNTKRGSSALGVAALDNWDVETEGKKVAKWSNYGSNCVSISAPGTRLITTVPTQFHKEGKFYALESGTSFATPIVAGVAALLKATYPTMRPSEIIDRIRTTADPIDEYNTDYRGHIGGRVNAYRALAIGKPKPAFESVDPTRLEITKRLSITIRNYDPTSRVVLTSITGGQEFIFLLPNSFSGTLDTFDAALPPLALPGTYRIRILSSSNEEISTVSELITILAIPSPPAQPTVDEPSTALLPLVEAELQADQFAPPTSEVQPQPPEVLNEKKPAVEKKPQKQVQPALKVKVKKIAPPKKKVKQMLIHVKQKSTKVKQKLPLKKKAKAPLPAKKKAIKKAQR